MGTAAVKIKIMPDSPASNLKEIEEKVKALPMILLSFIRMAFVVEEPESIPSVIPSWTSRARSALLPGNGRERLHPGKESSRSRAFGKRVTDN